MICMTWFFSSFYCMPVSIGIGGIDRTLSRLHYFYNKFLEKYFTIISMNNILSHLTEC